jgi:hypothetical protein
MTGRRGHSPFANFAGCPHARRVSIVAAVTFAAFMMGSWIGFGASLSIYSHWLEISQPITGSVAEVVPAIDSTTHYLEQHKDDPDTVTAIRNLQAINFVLLFFFALCFTVATFIDLFREPSRAYENIVAFTERTGLSTNKRLAYGALPVFLIFVALYLDFAGIATPWVSGGFASAIYGYAIMFGCGGYLLFPAICFVASLIIVKLQASVKNQR